MKNSVLWVVLGAFFALPIQAKDLTPLPIFTETTIELSQDIVIDTKTTPVLAQPSFGSMHPEKVIFSSATKKSIILKPTGILDLSSFNSKNKIIEFRNNAQLRCEAGAKIIFNNGVLRFSDSSRWIIE